MSTTAKADILIVDDEANTLASLSRAFRLAGHEATVCDNAAWALELAKSRPFDLILSDVVMPGHDGLSLLEDLKTQGVTSAGRDDVRTGEHRDGGARHAAGRARFSREAALHRQASADGRERAEAHTPGGGKSRASQRVGKHEIVWHGETMRRRDGAGRACCGRANRASASRRNRHRQRTDRAYAAREEPAPRGPFVTLNCAAVPAELIESELFGHEKGSFTGAAQRHAGKFEQAHRGTLFLDEIGDMPLPMQAKLLRVLEKARSSESAATSRFRWMCAWWWRRTATWRSW